MVNISIKSTDFNMTPDIEAYVREKLESLEKHVDLGGEENLLAEVEFQRSKHHKKGDVFRVEVNLSFKGKVIRSESKKHDPRVAIDDVRKQLDKRIRRSKGKRFDLLKRGGRKLKNLLYKNDNA
jgi:ribosomal subunit interface protein